MCFAHQDPNKCWPRGADMRENHQAWMQPLRGGLLGQEDHRKEAGRHSQEHGHIIALQVGRIVSERDCLGLGRGPERELTPNYPIAKLLAPWTNQWLMTGPMPQKSAPTQKKSTADPNESASDQKNPPPTQKQSAPDPNKSIPTKKYFQTKPPRPKTRPDPKIRSD